ncbi:uncharacterized protein METZ01_LOCUS291567 [marine metagenome]|uniref:Uncharacterized protein n=1 Tax=marine metagenome TaxID=408172 RepID=A0A382LQP3_9ZZZZ|tara:strand:- start:277 stop:480 length:204 start_codon:yes stop_codon:yes gene_type:complete
MAKTKQPNPVEGGWKEYKELVSTHIMNNDNKCLTHEDCHLDSFYPGKIYRKIVMKRNKDGFLVLDRD